LDVLTGKLGFIPFSVASELQWRLPEDFGRLSATGFRRGAHNKKFTATWEFWQGSLGYHGAAVLVRAAPSAPGRFGYFCSRLKKQFTMLPHPNPGRDGSRASGN